MPVWLTSISPCLVQYLAHIDAQFIIGFEEIVSNHFLRTYYDIRSSSEALHGGKLHYLIQQASHRYTSSTDLETEA